MQALNSEFCILNYCLRHINPASAFMREAFLNSLRKQ